MAGDLTTKKKGEWRFYLAGSIVFAALMGFMIGQQLGLSQGLCWFVLSIPAFFLMGITRAMRFRPLGDLFDTTKRVDESDVPPYVACIACRHPVELAEASESMKAKAAARLSAFSEERDR